jgi:hypothetical protein
LAPLTDATGSGLLHTPTAKANQASPSMRSRDPGSWFPTPKASDVDRGGRGDLLQVVRGNPSPSGHFRWPTPTASEGTGPGHATKGGMNLRTAIQKATPGSLNPTWVEWLMNFPLGWTEVD